MLLVDIFSESQTHVKVTDASVPDHSHLVLVQVRVVCLKMLVTRNVSGFRVGMPMLLTFHVTLRPMICARNDLVKRAFTNSGLPMAVS